MLPNFPAVSWAVTSVIVLVYFGAQQLDLGDPKGLLFIGLSPVVGAGVYMIRRRLQPTVREADEVVVDDDDVSRAGEAGQSDGGEAAVEPSGERVVERVVEPRVGPSAEVVRLARRRKLMLLPVMLFITPILSAISEIWTTTEQQWNALSLVDAVVISFAATMWCYFDCAEFGFRIRSGYRFLVFLTPVIGFPIYALKTRGLRGLPLILTGALFTMLNFALNQSAAMITRYFLPAEF